MRRINQTLKELRRLNAYTRLDFLKSLGGKIRIVRTQRGMNQHDMADELQISDVAYSKIERGLTNVSIMRLSQIANCLGIPLCRLLENTDIEMKGEINKQTDSLEDRIRNLEMTIKYLLE